MPPCAVRHPHSSKTSAMQRSNKLIRAESHWIDEAPTPKSRAEVNFAKGSLCSNLKWVQDMSRRKASGRPLVAAAKKHTVRLVAYVTSLESKRIWKRLRRGQTISDALRDGVPGTDPAVRPPAIEAPQPHQTNCASASIPMLHRSERHRPGQPPLVRVQPLTLAHCGQAAQQLRSPAAATRQPASAECWRSVASGANVPLGLCSASRLMARQSTLQAATTSGSSLLGWVSDTVNSTIPAQLVMTRPPSRRIKGSQKQVIQDLNGR